MTFAAPLYLVLLAIVLPLTVIALVRRERRRRADLQAFGDELLLGRSSPFPDPRRRVTQQALAVIALALVLVALARPQFGAKSAVLSRTGRDVLFVLDLSRSMNAEDVAPSRLAAAKQAARQIAAASPNDRVGLVIFGGSAFLQLPLTLDRSAFERFLDAATTDDLPDAGTNVADGLAIAATTLERDSEPEYCVVVVLSDGESLDGDVERAIRPLERRRIPVFTIGVGTAGGAPIPDRVGQRFVGYHRDAGGAVVNTRLEEETLRYIADETGGVYVRWDGDPSVRRLATDIARLGTREVSSRIAGQLADRYQWPLALALLALITESLVADRRKDSRR